MKILALDTSTEYCSVVLWHDGCIAERELNAGQQHSRLLLGMVDEVLKECGITLRDLDGIAYGQGPGSFTGLRIACGVTQGLAFAENLRVVGVSTLLAMAQDVQSDRVVCALDARMKEIYHAAYLCTAGVWSVVHAPAVSPPEAAPLLPEGEWIACGSGFEAYRTVLEKRYADRLVRVIPNVYPRARHIAHLAAAHFEKGETMSAEDAAPLYIRDKVALRTDERAA